MNFLTPDNIEQTARRMKLMQVLHDDRVLLRTVVALHQSIDAVGEPRLPPIAYDLTKTVLEAMAGSRLLPPCRYCKRPWPCTDILLARVHLDVLGILDGTYSDEPQPDLIRGPLG